MGTAWREALHGEGKFFNMQLQAGILNGVNTSPTLSQDGRANAFKPLKSAGNICCFYFTSGGFDEHSVSINMQNIIDGETSGREIQEK